MHIQTKPCELNVHDVLLIPCILQIDAQNFSFYVFENVYYDIEKIYLYIYFYTSM